MFGFRRRRTPPAKPVITYTFTYSARFTCNRPWEYQAVRACLLIAPERYSMLEKVEIVSWDWHTLVASFTVSVPWAGSEADATRHADATTRYMVACLAVGERLLSLVRHGGGRLEVADPASISRHPDLIALEEHCTTFYGGRDG